MQYLLLIYENEKRYANIRANVARELLTDAHQLFSQSRPRPVPLHRSDDSSYSLHWQCPVLRGIRSAMILVVEDDAEVREVIYEILVEQGYGVVCAENGALALDRVRDARPDLILLDLRMPVMGGAEFLGQLRVLDEGSAVPVVIMSASPNPAAEVGALSFQACLKKPFGMSELLVLVDRLGGKR